MSNLFSKLQGKKICHLNNVKQEVRKISINQKLTRTKILTYPQIQVVKFHLKTIIL